MTRRLSIGVGILLLLGLSRVGADLAKSPKQPKVESVQSVIDRVKLKNPDLPIRLFAQGENLTVNVVTPSRPLKAHLHAVHEEVIYVLQGHGKMRLGKKTREVKAGDIV